jgi:hypothetical protein
LIQIAIYYKRADFIWFGENDNKELETKYFGDTARALNIIETRLILDKHLEIMWVPSNINKYLYEYSHSTFLECNSTMAQINLENYPNQSFQDQTLNNKIKPGLMSIKAILESSYKKYWIASGSLLGKLACQKLRFNLILIILRMV